MERERQYISRWLREDDPSRLDALWHMADTTRREYAGNEVHFCGLIELSNFCARNCGHCGLRAANYRVPRHRLTFDQAMACVREAQDYQYGTVVLQAGEDHGLATAWVAELIRRIKAETPLAVTLSLGERSPADVEAWREAGADRYYLRLVTSDTEFYQILHGSTLGTPADRVKMLRLLKSLGYEIGSGIMAGIPGQTHASLVDDILLFLELDLDAVVINGYVAQPGTPLTNGILRRWISEGEQVPASEEMVCKLRALTRLFLPEINIASVTAHGLAGRGLELGLQRGANILIPNLTPRRYRAHDEDLPEQICQSTTAGVPEHALETRIQALGRSAALGPGNRPRLEPLEAGAENAAATPELRLAVCMGSSCFSRGNNRTIEEVRRWLREHGLEHKVALKGHLCEGLCNKGPNITLDDTLCHQVEAAKVIQLLREALKLQES